MKTLIISKDFWEVIEEGPAPTDKAASTKNC